MFCQTLKSFINAISAAKKRFWKKNKQKVARSQGKGMGMDLKQASKKELYAIATDSGARLLERYKAARELQKRREMNVHRNRSVNENGTCSPRYSR